MRISVPIPGFLLKDTILRYHNKETVLFTIDPCFGTFNLKPSTLIKETRIDPSKEPL